MQADTFSDHGKVKSWTAKNDILCKNFEFDLFVLVSRTSPLVKFFDMFTIINYHSSQTI